MSKIVWTVLFFLTINAVLTADTETNKQQGARIVFYVQNQIEQPEDYVQISIEIKSQHPSLQKAINQAQHIVQKVESTIKQYCDTHAKNKKDCQDVVETSEYKIDPIYQLIRKVPTFVAFSVSHETVAKIQDVKDIGKLTDDILKSGVSKINSFEWKPLEQIDNEEQVVSEGIELVNSICSQIGMQLGRIVAVSEVTDYEEKQEEEKPAEKEGEQGEEKEEEEQEKEESTVVYKFEIICQEKGKSKK